MFSMIWFGLGFVAAIVLQKKVKALKDAIVAKVPFLKKKED